MTIYLIDGSALHCEELEIGFSRTGALVTTNLIADEYRVIPAEEIVRIVDGKED